MVMRMSSRELERVIRSQLNDIKDGHLGDETIESLLLTCGDSMLLAALDLIDSREVSKIVAPSGRALYQCSGTSKTYTIHLEPLYCPCPAFSQQVLYLDAHVVCKHLLACLLAQRLNRFIMRNGTLDLLAIVAGAQTAQATTH